MMSLVADLVPFALGAAIVPAVVMVTLVLVRSRAGPIKAAAWVLGMVAVRLIQGAVFGSIVPAQPRLDATGQSSVVATILLVLSILMFATAARKALGGEDEEDSAHPPKWMSMIRSVTPARALLYGALLMIVSGKQWVFTLGAISTIGALAPGRGATILAYFAFVATAVSPSLAIVAMVYLAPEQSAPRLDATLGWLRTHNDAIVIGIGVVFGSVFGVTALRDFGIL